MGVSLARLPTEPGGLNAMSTVAPITRPILLTRLFITFQYNCKPQATTRQRPAYGFGIRRPACYHNSHRDHVLTEATPHDWYARPQPRK